MTRPYQGLAAGQRTALLEEILVKTTFNHRVAVLGAGKMGGILLGGFLNKELVSPENTVATVEHAEKAVKQSSKFGIPVGTSNAEAVKNADIILLCVKPQVVTDVLEQ